MSNDSKPSHGSLLGRDTAYPDSYAPSLLEALPRRRPGNAAAFGEDIWNQYELSWLDGAGYPCVGALECRLPCSSPSLIESKSMKLYFNSLNQTRFASPESMLERVKRDLSACAGAEWQLVLKHPLPLLQTSSLAQTSDAHGTADAILDVGDQLWVDGRLVDKLIHASSSAGPQLPAAGAERSVLLRLADDTVSAPAVEDVLVSHLLKTNCPVTGQPDWASVLVWTGPAGAGLDSGRRIDPQSLLDYLVSYRQHSGFHEQCVEEVFADLTALLGEDRGLLVYARYTRRGGIDINPWRSNVPARVANTRLLRQ
ncbi:NADPH-dependent 7-cyano-7-deazaguanine reductase QueF [Allohahella marinimesophila]|uniref:NADPH-dependent 7-cyano-7-deazaguanine reductase QueF n=1 Tax=Allohahella marinimesophila TaxID=1054972 RepID=A0ABP7NWE3_9GAMM